VEQRYTHDEEMQEQRLIFWRMFLLACLLSTVAMAVSLSVWSKRDIWKANLLRTRRCKHADYSSKQA
jgi:hypothetical protein